MNVSCSSYLLLIIVFIGILGGCSVKPKSINYGQDACEFCTMTIVDKVHAAQVVTTKGKAYSFDAIECMINYLQKMNEDEIALHLTNELKQPEKLIDAKTATFLRSEAIPSPMGEYLSAFYDKEVAQSSLEKYGGQLFSWEELNTYFLNKKE